MFWCRRAVSSGHPGASAHLLYKTVGGVQDTTSVAGFFEHAEPELAEPEEELAKPLGADNAHLLEEEAAGNDSRRIL